jgi:hypothetical protein
MLAQRARHFTAVRFFYFLNVNVLYICFFGLDSGGTKPDTR